MYTTTFKVKGSGTFPVDMLRYDTCYPKDSRDALRIGGLEGSDEVGVKSIVYLQINHGRKNDAHITPERWKSFGWEAITARLDDDLHLGTHDRG